MQPIVGENGGVEDGSRSKEGESSFKMVAKAFKMAARV